MKKSVAVLTVIGGLLAGCVGYEVQNESQHRDSTAYRYDRDRDRDGVPDRRDYDRDGDRVPNDRDRRPDDPRRY